MNSIFEADLLEIANSKIIDFEKLKNQKILITGATGLIGSILVKSILLKNKMSNLNIKLILLVRDIENAQKIYENEENIEYIESSVENYIPRKIDVDYIIHLASPTKSKYFIEKPVETMETIIMGTRNMLAQARISSVKSFVYLSSMEVYGQIDNDNVIEDMLGYVSLSEERSCYPECKRVCELLNYNYYQEYDVPIKNVRLAQTFGAGISKDETRVYKMFCDSVLNSQDIILKTKGTTIVNFCYTTDAIQGILKVLLDGKNGETYNIVSDNTDNMSILDCAKWLVKTYTNNTINIIFDIDSKAFARDSKMILSNEKIKSIGWEAKYNVLQGYDRLIQYLKEENNE